MLYNLIPKTGTPQLNTLGSVFPDLTQCGQCSSFINISLKGAFKENGRFWLEFEVSTEKSIRMSQIAIANRTRHEIDIMLVDWPLEPKKTESYFLETDMDFATLSDWTLSFRVNRGGKRSIWKYTKGHGQGAPKKKRWWQRWFRRQ